MLLKKLLRKAKLVEPAKTAKSCSQRQKLPSTIGTDLKVSATLQDRPRADRCSVSCFYKNPYKPHIF